MSSVVPKVLSLGSKGLYEALVRDAFRGGGRHRVEEIRAYCIASRYRAAAHIEGALRLLLNIGVLIVEDDFLRLDADVLQIAESGGIGLAICGRLVDRLAAGGEIESYFPPGSMSWGATNGEMNLHLSRVPMGALPIVKLLRDLGVASDSEETAVLLKVHEPFATILRGSIFSGVAHRRRVGTLTPEQLARLQEENDEQGAEAEGFVLELEINRLKDHPQLELVRRVSQTNASAGYDIESFEGSRSFMPDRFIEVKSYRASDRFFISIGEIEAAKELGDRYFLCLVDMRKIGVKDYLPTFIQNPAAQLFGADSDWSAVAVKFEMARKQASEQRGFESPTGEQYVYSTKSSDPSSEEVVP